MLRLSLLNFLLQDGLLLPTFSWQRWCLIHPFSLSNDSLIYSFPR
jgi:hypothetical protein